MNMYEDVKVSYCLMDTIDNETLQGTVLDMKGYEGVAFYAIIAKGEAVSIDLKVQGGDLADGSDAADLAGTLVAADPAVGTDGQAFVDVYRPIHRYVRPAAVSADATTPPAIAIVAMQYGAHERPVTQGATAAEFHASPAEGTA